MRIDAVQWFLSRRKYYAVGVTVGFFLLVFILNCNGADHQEVAVKGGHKLIRRQAVDDDEVHDQDILSAVRSSLKEWSERSKAKNRLANFHRVKRDEEIVCYGELGCFRDEGPFDYLDMLPSPPEEISTKFLFFTRKNLQNAQIFSYFNFTTSMLGTTHFNSSNPTKVIIHGFGSTCQRMWAYEMHLAILREWYLWFGTHIGYRIQEHVLFYEGTESGQYNVCQTVEANVICVDWENGAALPNYVRAAVNTRLVGKQVALLIFWLNENLGARTEDFHLIGFSLGAHVAGFTGQELQNLSRITGLDPAGPLFESYDTKVRLDSSDALFVDVIHSNGDSLLMGGLGSWEPMGHVDFYPNGGRVQKGCSNLFLGAVRDFLWSASDGDGRSLCNHRRAYKFFTESLSNRCRFPAFACDSYDKYLTGSCFTWDNNRCGDMGYYADRLPNPKKGLLYLVTRDDEPFCANQYRVTVESSPSSASISTYGGLEAILIGHDFINETFLITQTLKDNMVAGNVIQRMIVAHPAITEPIQIQLKYTAYQGWLYSGISRWSMDSLILTNAYGKSMSFCTRILLPSGIPVTIRLTAGVCLNRFPPPGVATNPIGRPIFPHHPYDPYPTPGTDPNTTPVSGENITSSTAVSISGFDDMDIDLSMKPPAMTSVQHNPSGNSAEIGPPYNMVDWSEWQPLPNSQFRPLSPTGSQSHHQHHINMGTPVEVFPPLDEENSSDIVKIESDLELNTLSNNNHNGSTNNSADLAETMPEPIVIRICHIVVENSTINGTTVPGDQKLSCVLPDATKNNTVTTNANGKINDTLLAADRTDTEVNLISPGSSGPASTEQEALQSNILVIHSNPTSTDMSIPPQSFWTAMHNNSMSPPVGEYPQYQGADPDVVLPPHLSYILQQLESQGLGPKVSTLNPHYLSSRSPDNVMASNTINGGNNLRSFRGIGLPQLARVQISAAAGPNKHRGLVASSRALKHRPVSLSNRRQSKLLDGAGPGLLGQVEAAASHPSEKTSAILVHGIGVHRGHFHRSMQSPQMKGQGLMAQNTIHVPQIVQSPVHISQAQHNSHHIPQGAPQPHHNPHGPQNSNHISEGIQTPHRISHSTPQNPLHLSQGSQNPLHISRGPQNPLHLSQAAQNPLHLSQGVQNPPLHMPQGGQNPLHTSQGGQNPLHISQSAQTPVQIAQESIQKSYIRSLPPPPSFGSRPVSPSSGGTNKKPPVSTNPIFYVTNQPKGYYLMPHYSFTSDRVSLPGIFKLRRIVGPPSASINNGGGGGGGFSPTIIAPTNPTPNSEITLNNLQNVNNGNFYDDHRHRHAQNKILRPTSTPGRTL